MDRVILIRMGELFLKGNNKGFFISMLKTNLINALQPIKLNFTFSQNRYFVEDYDVEDEDEIIDRIKKVFGVYSLSVAVKVKSDFNLMSEAVKECFLPEEGQKFRVTVNRGDKRFSMTSVEIAKELGGVVLSAKRGVKVDLYDFDYEIKVDLRENGYTYIFTDIIPGAGGLPVGCSGKGLLLLSGGIDSPVAGYKMAKRGMSISAIHFHSFPYTSELALDKVIRLARLIKPYTGGFNLYIVSFTHIQEAIHENCPADFMITIMRRFMMRIAERIADQNKLSAIITGESLGQVASQTVESMTSTESVLKCLPVFRPLIAQDKEEIIEVARKIGTFETSIEPFEDCCTVFLPKNPVIHPKLKVVEKFEAALDIDALVEKALENVRIEKI